MGLDCQSVELFIGNMNYLVSNPDPPSFIPRPFIKFRTQTLLVSYPGRFYKRKKETLTKDLYEAKTLPNPFLFGGGGVWV